MRLVGWTNLKKRQTIFLASEQSGKCSRVELAKENFDKNSAERSSSTD
jgi:hypothetical protein